MLRRGMRGSGLRRRGRLRHMGRPHRRARGRWRWRRRGRPWRHGTAGRRARRWRRRGRGCRSLGARTTRRFGFDLADGFFQRQTLARDFRLFQRRVDSTQLRNQRRARPIIERTASLAGVPIEPGDSARDQWIIIGHCTLYLSTFPPNRPILKPRTGSASILCLHAPGWSRVMPPGIQPVPRSA